MSAPISSPFARGFGLAMAALLGVSLASCTETGAPEGSIAPGELLQQLSSSHPPVVLDVRTPAEYARGHVPGARNVPHTEIGDHLDALTAAREEPVVVYCERGGRARAAEAVLRDAGFRVRHLEGDMSAWRAEGRPTEAER